MACLQYYYENPEDAEKYKINCNGKIFENLNDVDTFNNKDLLEFIKNEYSGEAFPENSPFEFKDNYINLSNNEICKSTEMSLAPQQKFMGQIMGPSSNFNNMLIFHGLGSGKSCTSIVVGEALKNASNQRLLFVVPAPLVDQYYEEIAGEIRNGKFFSCPSFCLIRNGGKLERDFYVSQAQNSILLAKMRQYTLEENNLNNIQEKIDLGDNTPTTAKLFKDQENKLNVLKRQLNNYQKDIRSKIIRTFEIVTHQTFIESIYKTGKDGQLIKGSRLLEDTALFHENGLLIIDEIQRLVSAGGIFYKKLYNAIKYYFHPNLRMAVMSATPIYDNPYELALTINLLRPRVPFPIDQKDFYNFFVGEYSDDNKCIESSKSKSWISENSCIINKDLIRYICSGYVSYFKGGNPNAYPYKRIITMEHIFSQAHKSEYINALKSDVTKDKNFGKKIDNLGAYENILLGNYETESEDKISGMYVTTQQYSNIFLPKIGENINKTITEKKQALQSFKTTLLGMKFKNPTDVINYVKMYSSKFASIIELTLSSPGPVFIFSNWLTYGVEPLAIILEACGLTQFDREDRGNGRYFIWSSETKTKDRDGTLVKKARNVFNSNENKDGSLLKVILGTRSVMEGVSFKNVKQVHITEPWWNESRIEQILARASRYCSHSTLPINDQYVDIYRHYSVLPVSGNRDEEVAAALGEIGNPDWQGLSTYGIDQKMLMSSLKKYSINNELELVLKSCSIDSEINKNGNIIRLEEHVIPTAQGTYQIFYKNPSNGRMYIREGIPENVTFMQIYNREFSYPNKDFPLKFTESYQGEFGKMIPFSDPEVLTDPVINADLNMKENIEPWDSSKTFNSLDLKNNLREYMTNLYKNYNLIPIIRKNYFNQTGGSIIKFKDDPVKRIKLIKCIKELSIQNLVSKEVKKEIAQEFNKSSQKQKINSKVLDLIYKYNIYPESYLEELLEIAVNNPDSINQTLKTVASKI
tara:strand:- start:194 stop:3136 length:2943 start_codon:yes stop_codon:yes gene_type:complete